MKVLIACEFSGIVRDAFIAAGHDAVSCDLLPTERPGPHIQDDVLNHLGEGWDRMIGFPPCTHVANAGGRWFPTKRMDGRQEAAIRFFIALLKAPINSIALENPVGILGSHQYLEKHFSHLKLELESVGMPRKPDQVIQPFYFGHGVRKYTCLWLKNLRPLVWVRKDDMFYKSQLVMPEEPVNVVIRKGAYRTGTARKLYWYDYLTGPNAAKIKSKTFSGIAEAMAQQWGR